MSDTDLGAVEEENPHKFQPKSLIIKISIFIIVLVIGAAIFQAIEKKNDNIDAESEKALYVKVDIITKYNITSDDFDKFLSAVEDEIRLKELAKKPRWTFSNSVFLAFSIMTTIGYGHLTPKTSGGQIFCILYSLVAIPVAGIMLISVGSHVSLALQKFISFVEKKLLRREMGLNTEMKSTVVTFVFMILIIIFGAILTSHTDGWTFVEGMYFIFISLSTIGFGDYIINDGELNDPDDKKSVAVNFTIVLITVGLCVVSSVLCSVSSVIEEKQKRMRMHMSAGNIAGPGRMALSAVTKITKTGKNDRSEAQKLNNENEQV
ncbi:two pore potassium channel protein sup-9-like [Actinia tenebrosa]|uniref:Two pore potassium channel protein sup-9-like n=1 Tax=Actinia tenebrosa TaxID=6105 RepID=A0A6P8HP97_ACTTE|nr:two pore potassium channel protein sup-9-like [Actinia tenebrosa]